MRSLCGQQRTFAYCVRRYDLTSTFSVLVGAKPHRQRFTVHHDLITQRSEFFRAARSLCWTEPGKVTRLVDDDPHIFSAYLSCLYFGAKFMDRQGGRPRQGDSIPSSDLESGSSADVNDYPDDDDDDKMIDGVVAKKFGPCAEHIENVRFLIDIYLLADKYLDPTTANPVIDKLAKFVVGKPWTTDEATISHVYASTGDRNPLRKLVRDWWLFSADQSWALERPKSDRQLPLEFLQDLIIETSGLRKAYGPGPDIFKGLARAGAVPGVRYAYHM
jgi:hypothetical protein